jgi:hypothetical protein
MKLGLGCTKAMMEEAEAKEEANEALLVDDERMATAATAVNADVADGSTVRATDKKENSKKINKISNVHGLSSDEDYNEDGDDNSMPSTSKDETATGAADPTSPDTLAAMSYSGRFIANDPANMKIYNDKCRANKHIHGTTIHSKLSIHIVTVNNIEEDQFNHLPLQAITKTPRPVTRDSLAVRSAVRQMVRFTNAIKMLYCHGEVYELPFICPVPRAKCVSGKIDELYVLRGSMDKVSYKRHERETWLTGLYCPDDSDSSEPDVVADSTYTTLCIEDIKTHEESYNYNKNISVSTTIKGEVQLSIYKYAMHRLSLMAAIPDSDPRSKKAWLLGREPKMVVHPSALNSMLRLSSRDGQTPVPQHLKEANHAQNRLLKKRNAVMDGNAAADTLTLEDVYVDLLCACTRYMLPSPVDCSENISLQIRHISHKTFTNLSYLADGDSPSESWGDVVSVNNANLGYIAEALSSIDGLKLKCLPATVDKGVKCRRK